MSNELHLSKSLYLQQHAENPVHWKQWSQDVLDEAQLKDKLVLISIGYSSCHWCHVMEHESFEDGAVASLMNAHYTSIKVDREERPDLDARYMSAVQLMTGQGGWPLNVIALPDGTPVWGGTYFSKADWSAALEQIAQLWREDRETVLSYGTKMQEGLKELVAVHKDAVADTFTPSDLEDVLVPWMRSWDPNWGGNNRAPKFPMPTNYQYLLQYGIVTGQSAVLDYVHHTLERMSYGGLYDSVHGGFTRYATDRFWKVPHFEKMLYDNGQLLQLFALAQRHRPSEHYAQILRQTWSFLQQHMALPCGLFGAALDADSPTPESPREEGGFYTWSKEELVTEKLWEQEHFREYFDLGPHSAWEGKYILHRPLSDEEFCAKFELSMEELKALKTQWFDVLEKASRAREQSHPKPALDPKAIVSWNALLVSGLAQAHWALPHEGFDRAAAQLLEHLWTLTYTDQGLHHQYIDQPSG
ncbi:MAG: thioredoxin domain-containing protein, partial [Schleiferiaceae bacterium]